MTDWNELISDVVAGNWKDPVSGKAAIVPFEVIRIEEDFEGGEADLPVDGVQPRQLHDELGRRLVEDRERLGHGPRLLGEAA